MLPFNPGRFGRTVFDPAGGGGGDAPETTAFLARTSGLDATHVNAYKALINGLVSDGNFSLLDALWIFATQDATTAALNLVSTSFSVTPVSSPTFTADRGYAGNGTSSYIDTNFTPSTNGVQFTLNSASFGIYDRAAATTFGPHQGGVYTNSTAEVVNLDSDNTNNFHARINQDSGTNTSIGNAAANYGFVAIVRTGASATNLYQSGSSIQTGTGASTALPSASIFLDARRLFGSASGFTTDQIAAAFVGSGSINQATFYSRIQTFMTTVGANVN